jgi:hypothetical protein
MRVCLASPTLDTNVTEGLFLGTSGSFLWPSGKFLSLFEGGSGRSQGGVPGIAGFQVKSWGTRKF